MTNAGRDSFIATLGLMFVGLVSPSCDGASAVDNGDVDDVAVGSESALHHAGRGRGPKRGHHHHGHNGGTGPCTGAGGHAGAGGAASGGSGVGGSVVILPDASGWVDASSNPLGIHGGWFPFADSYGPDGSRNGQCQAAGHADSECTVITTPNPAALSFPNVNGRMCTSGTVARVLPLNGEPDYGHMWGGGIGLNLAASATGDIGVFDASAHSVVGLSFDIDRVPPGGLRVMFPTPFTRSLPVVGPDYWGASFSYPPSPVVAGTNVVMLSDVRSPESSPRPLDVTQIESVLFLVPATVSTALDFNFCISNLKILVQ